MPDEILTGWGGAQRSRSTVLAAASVEDVQRAVLHAGPRGVLAQGRGRAYGDAALNAGGTVLDVSTLDKVVVADDGVVQVGAGTTIARLIDALLPHGRFVPVTPGTAQVSIGGAVAADVHGKNHHRDGSIGAHLESVDLVTADGEQRTVRPDGPDDALFRATTGGMGLTGIITGARLRTIEVPGPLMSVDTRRADDLDAVMAGLVDADARHRYSVAWLDTTSRGRRLGRGVLTSGDHVAATDQARAVDVGPLLTVPWRPPARALTGWAISAFNEAYFRRAPRERLSELQHVSRFFHPLDSVGAWNRLYGPRGIVQYQFAVPDPGADLVPLTLRRLQEAGAPSFLTVLKRFGPAFDAPLSFPVPGWTLALDIPADVAGLGAVLDRLDAEVVARGGRVYLAKDSRTAPEVLEAMYPRLAEWRSTVLAVDPHGVLRSDLARRLAL